MKVLDIGCGDDPVEGADTLDRMEKFNPDIVHDITEFPLPIDENEYDKIVMKDVFEHLPTDGKYLDNLFQELDRILVDGGKIEIRVPYYTSSCGAGDVQHSTNGYSAQFHLEYIDTELEVKEKRILFHNKKYSFIEDFVNQHQIMYERMLGISHILPAVNLEIVLE